MAVKPSAIRSPTPDLPNHQVVLTQLKEITETAQRLRGDPSSSFVTLGELVSAGIVKFVGGVVSPASKSTLGINVANSITGDGSSAHPLELIGDAASPGNNKVYGTNGSGVKGWYTGGGGSYTPPVTTKGDIFTFSTTPDRLAVGANGTFLEADSTQATGLKWGTPSGGGGTAVPGTIPDLTMWWESDDILGAAGALITKMRERTPWITGVLATAQAGTTSQGVPIYSGTLNSLPVLSWANNPSANMAMPAYLPVLHQVTVFAVFRPHTLSTPQSTCLSGGSGALEFNIGNSTANAMSFNKSFTAGIGQATTTWTAGTWYQGNGSYDESTGNWSFRQARAAAGSGTSTQTISQFTSTIGYNPNAPTNYNLDAELAALIVYNRVLSGSEITAVENYLFAKWGV